MKGLDLHTSDQILQTALAKEQEARNFYDEQAAHCTIGFVKELLERLKDEESKHVRLIQGMIAKLNAGRNVL